MTFTIDRRQFAAALTGAAAWPITARGQQQKPMQVIGVLASPSPSAYSGLLAEFRRALSNAGLVEGRDIKIEYRWADDRYERLPGLAAELVRMPVAVIFAIGGGQAALAAQAATATIPIVFANGSDPVTLGLVASLNRPGGNITGVTSTSGETGPKQLQFISELLPSDAAIGLMLNPANPNTEESIEIFRSAGNALGREILIANVASDHDLNSAFDILKRRGARGLVVSADPIFLNRRDRLITLAARHILPTIYSHRATAEQGGLMSYDADRLEGYGQAARYISRILKGEKPADLPVIRAATFKLVINLRTAKSLDFDIPAKLLALADEVIE